MMHMFTLLCSIVQSYVCTTDCRLIRCQKEIIRLQCYSKLVECIALWGDPEPAVARRGEEQQPGWLSLLHLYVTNQGRWNISLASLTHFCRKWVRLARLAEHVHIVRYLCLAVVSCAWPHPIQRPPQQLHEQHALLYFIVLHLLILCSLYSVLCALSHLFLHFLFSFFVCEVYHMSLREHVGSISTTLRQSYKNMMHDSISITFMLKMCV